jgi:predicted phosphoribosyltransferase
MLRPIWTGGVCDEAVFLAEPDDFGAVGKYYADFHQLEDEEVRNLLGRPNRAHSEQPPAY